jgi:uncharacterized iron-regulated protein
MVAPRDALQAFLPVVPTSRRVFFRGENAIAFFRVYQGGKLPAAPVTLAVSVTDAQGVIRFQKTDAISASAFKDSRSSDHRLDLAFDRLAPGPHLLTIRATAGTGTLLRHVRFEVE